MPPLTPEQPAVGSIEGEKVAHRNRFVDHIPMEHLDLLRGPRLLQVHEQEVARRGTAGDQFGCDRPSPPRPAHVVVQVEIFARIVVRLERPLEMPDRLTRVNREGPHGHAVVHEDRIAEANEPKGRHRLRVGQKWILILQQIVESVLDPALGKEVGPVDERHRSVAVGPASQGGPVETRQPHEGRIPRQILFEPLLPASGRLERGQVLPGGFLLPRLVESARQPRHHGGLGSAGVEETFLQEDDRQIDLALFEVVVGEEAVRVDADRRGGKGPGQRFERPDIAIVAGPVQFDRCLLPGERFVDLAARRRQARQKVMGHLGRADEPRAALRSPQALAARLKNLAAMTGDHLMEVVHGGREVLVANFFPGAADQSFRLGCLGNAEAAQDLAVGIAVEGGIGGEIPVVPVAVLGAGADDQALKEDHDRQVEP